MRKIQQFLYILTSQLLQMKNGRILRQEFYYYCLLVTIAYTVSMAN